MSRHPIRSLQRRVDDRRRARTARLPLDEVDLPEQLDHPAFDALPKDEQDYRRRRAVATLARRQRRFRRSIAVGAMIFAVTLVVSLSAENTLRDGQTREARARAAAIAQEAVARAASVAAGVAEANYEECRTISTTLGSIREGIIKAEAPTSTKGVTDPVTLRRIVASNLQRAATRNFFRRLIPDLKCPKPRP